MTRRFETPQALRAALDDRLRNEAKLRGVPIETLRTKLLIERLLARLFSRDDTPWLLKGGYAFELRYRPRARTARDIDLSVTSLEARSVAARIERVRDELQQAAKLDLGDFLRFAIGVARGELAGPPHGGATFPVIVRLADKEYGRFHIDVSFGDAKFGVAEVLVGDDLLAFAGTAPSRVSSRRLKPSRSM